MENILYIRKISIGSDYKNSMHYIVGQNVLGGNYIIHEIVEESKGYSVWIKSNGEVVRWKQFIDIPVVIEYNLL